MKTFPNVSCVLLLARGNDLLPTILEVKFIEYNTYYVHITTTLHYALNRYTASNGHQKVGGPNLVAFGTINFYPQNTLQHRKLWYYY